MVGGAVSRLTSYPAGTNLQIICRFYIVVAAGEI